jgi:dynein intermediate chain 2
VQVIPEMSEHEANTNEVLFSKHNINHEEGGWPKDVDYAEAEHTIRFRKKAEKDEDYIRLVAQLGSRAEARVMQNNAIDIYQQYYTSELTDIVAEVGTLHAMNGFPVTAQKKQKKLSWSHEMHHPRCIRRK